MTEPNPIHLPGSQNVARPIDRLLTVREVVKEAAGRGAVDASAVVWLDNAIDAYLSGESSLEQALGLAGGVGRRKALTMRLIQERDNHIRAAASNLQAPSVKNLRVAIRRFQSDLWPRWRDHTEPPTDDPVKANLFAAFKIGLSVPSSITHLHEICGSCSDE